ncbi:MFS transporter [Euzebya tangerina]|uniref:MFS transporter n=1 Tax=Euzebya tangerina TaxID=591198 RepID=UPI000E317666|nr:MFS transporter [Euzebya tangerina]
MERAPLYRLLSALYITQFIGVGFLLVGLTGILRENGASLESLGIIQGLGLVWAVKFLWSPVVDRFGGRRSGHYRPCLLVLQTAMVLTLLTMLGVSPDPDDFGALMALAALLVFFSATQDIAADALAVRLIAVEDRGTANGVQVAAGYVGNLLGGGLTVVVFDPFGWTAAMLLLAAMTATALVVVIRFREQDTPPLATPASLGVAYRSLRTVFHQPGAGRWALVVVPLLYLGVAVSYGLLTPALVDIGWSLTRIGVVLSLVASVPAAIGGFVGGALVSRYGRLVPVLAGSAIKVAATLALLPMFGGSRNDALIITAICVYLTSYSATTSVIYTVNMDYSRTDSAGSDYTLMSSIGMIWSFIAGGVGLGIAGAVGYVPVVIGSAVLLVVGVGVYARHLRGHENLLRQQMLERERDLVLTDATASGSR